MATFSLTAPSKHPRFDTIIGLDVAGTLFYCRKSTLLSEKSYFAARFGPDSMMDPQLDRVAENGREIYFIDRNPDMFRYVLEYLRKNKLPPEIGTFQENPGLWRSLRDEAEFFSLEGLTALLSVTYSCSPDVNGGQGILHWLGTNRGKEAYVNPYRRRAVDVTGWFDDFATLGEHDLSWGSSERKEYFVQYRPIPNKAISEDDTICPGVNNVLFPCLAGCNHSGERLPVMVDLRSTTVSPTHYSLRYGACRGMDGSWNFEGSIDGANWIVLHEGKKSEGHKLTHEYRQRRANSEADWFREMRKGEAAYTPLKEWEEVYCDYMERHHRDTWQVKNDVLPGPFFRYFRIIGADSVGEGSGCLHCIGLELYGKVHEE